MYRNFIYIYIYGKGRRGREVFSIHPFVSSSIQSSCGILWLPNPPLVAAISFFRAQKQHPMSLYFKCCICFSLFTNLNGCPKHVAQSEHYWMSWLFFMKFFHVTRPSVSSSIHPSVLSSIHGWHHTRKKILAKLNNPPPSAHVSLSRKDMPSPEWAPPRFWNQYQQQTQHWTMLGYICYLRSFTMVSCMLLSHGS